VCTATPRPQRVRWLGCGCGWKKLNAEMLPAQATGRRNNTYTQKAPNLAAPAALKTTGQSAAQAQHAHAPVWLPPLGPQPLAAGRPGCVDRIQGPKRGQALKQLRGRCGGGDSLGWFRIRSFGRGGGGLGCGGVGGLGLSQRTQVCEHPKPCVHQARRPLQNRPTW